MSIGGHPSVCLTPDETVMRGSDDRGHVMFPMSLLLFIATTIDSSKAAYSLEGAHTGMHCWPEQISDLYQRSRSAFLTFVILGLREP